MLEKIRYSEHNWLIRANLKVIAVLTGFQLGTWITPNIAAFYACGTLEQKVNIMSESSGLPDWYLTQVSTTLQIFPWFHEKAFTIESQVFQFLQKVFPNLSVAKIKKGVFVGLQIRKLILNKEFDKILHGNEFDAWVGFKKVCTDFLGCHYSENFRDVTAEMLNTYKILECKMSLKVHFLDSHVDFFHKNTSDFLMNMENDFTRTHLLSITGIKENGL